MKKYFADYPLEERKALWEKYLPRVQNEFDDYNYGIARDSFAETFPDYMNMTEFEGVPFNPKDKSHVALANMFGWDDSYWDNWENDYTDTDSVEKTGAYEMESFETMFRKAKGYDMKEEADTSDYEPVDEKKEAQDKQRRAVGDKLTDEDGNSRLKHKANVPALENYDQDIHAPQGEVHDADKLKATKKSAGFREMVARNCFEKTGRIPDVEFMDTYEVKKAADEADFDEMDGEEPIGDSGAPTYSAPDASENVISKPRVSTPEGLYSALKDMGYSHNFWDHKAHENYKTMANDFLTRHPNPDITDPKYHAYYLDMGLKKRKEAAPNLPTSAPVSASAPAPVEDYGTRIYDAPDDAIPDYYDGSPLPTAPDAKARVAEKNKQAKERAKSSSKGQSQMTLDGAEHQQMVDKISGAKNRAELEAVLNNMGYFRK